MYIYIYSYLSTPQTNPRSYGSKLGPRTAWPKYPKIEERLWPTGVKCWPISGLSYIYMYNYMYMHNFMYIYIHIHVSHILLLCPSISIYYLPSSIAEILFSGLTHGRHPPFCGSPWVLALSQRLGMWISPRLSGWIWKIGGIGLVTV